MFCPRDNSPLLKQALGDVHLHYCDQCLGIWLDYGELMILYAAYLKETDGESFFREDTRRFISSLFMRRIPISINDKGKIEMSGFLSSLNAALAPLDIIRWIFNSSVISKLFDDKEKYPE